MKNKAINTLGYTGVVTLYQYIGKNKKIIKKIHNSGGNALFMFLADCLLGDYEIAKYERPTKIMLLNSEITETKAPDNSKVYTFTDAKKASGFIYLLTKPEKVYNTSGSTVRYSFMIPRDLLESTTFNSIGLYSDQATISDAGDYAAICKADVTQADLAVSSVLVVDWELTIANKNYHDSDDI